MRSFIGRRDELRLGSTSLGSTPGSCFGAGAGLLWANLAGGNALDAWDFLTNQARWNGSGIGPLSNTPGWSYTRSDAQTAYAQTSAGVLTPFATGVLRRTDKGVLIEGARTNLCLQSQTFDNASWSKVRSSISADAVVAPDGTTTADKLVEDSTASNTHRAQQSITVSSATAYTFSVFLKAAERTWACLTFFDGTTTWNLYVNLGSGVLGTAAGSPTATSISALANGWYRVSMTMTTGNTAGQVQIYTATADNTQSYTGDGTSGIYLWGAQLEAGSFPSSLVTTTTASATRAADSLSITGVTGLDSAPISTFAEIELVGAAADERGIISVDNGATATNIAQYLYVNSASLLKGLVVSGGATQWDAGAAAIATDVTVKVAGRSATNDFNAASGGALTGSDASGSLSASTTQIRFGNRYWNGAKPIFGYLRRAALWNRALTDSELQTVTT